MRQGTASGNITVEVNVRHPILVAIAILRHAAIVSVTSGFTMCMGSNSELHKCPLAFLKDPISQCMVHFNYHLVLTDLLLSFGSYGQLSGFNTDD